MTCPECEFHDVLTEERCSDLRCRPYHVHLPDGRVLERWLCDLHAFMSEPEAVPCYTGVNRAGGAA